MIRALVRPRFALLALGAVFLVSVGGALTGANGVPVTHVGVERIPLPEALLLATVRIDPETLNARAPGGATVFLTLPGPHGADEIVPSSVEMCLLLRCTPGDGRSTVEGGGVLQVKFDRDAVRGVLFGASGWVTLTVDGQLSAPPGRFQGSDSVRVV